jgi:hypothetical protein
MRKAAVIAKAAALSLLALTLSGCFTSEDELVGYWAADRPIETGVWAHWPTHPDGTEWDRETWRGEIDLERRRYRSDEENFPHEGARLKRLSGNIYLAQIPREGGVGYGVAWVYEDGHVLSYHQPDCGVLTEAVLDTYTLARDPEGFCTVTGLDQIEAVMGAYLDAVGEAIIVDGVYRRVE